MPGSERRYVIPARDAEADVIEAAFRRQPVPLYSLESLRSGLRCMPVTVDRDFLGWTPLRIREVPEDLRARLHLKEDEEEGLEREVFLHLSAFGHRIEGALSCDELTEGMHALVSRARDGAVYGIAIIEAGEIEAWARLYKKRVHS